MARPSFQSISSVNSSSTPPGLSPGGDQFRDHLKKKKKSGFQNLPSDSILYFKADLGQVGSLVRENNNKLFFYLFVKEVQIYY